MMLGRLLNAGYISQARELAALFEHDSPDLTIVLVRHTYMYMQYRSDHKGFHL